MSKKVNKSEKSMSELMEHLKHESKLFEAILKLEVKNTDLTQRNKELETSLEKIVEINKNLGNEVLSRFVLTAMLANTVCIAKQALTKGGSDEQAS